MKLAEAKIKLSHLYDQVLKNLEDSTPEITKLALDALDIKVYASTERVEIQGVIPLELPTIEQTSGRTKHYRKLHVIISAEIREHKLDSQTLLLA